ncbi:steroid 17-alpha-hydroxylase/17,20 lyase-like [Lingula anatina]|uniref:Steroid 17-alpha-hydroxylase/17,20 lyase-like n=1 Tax=Lingula anatina TaxID=7574 RepID=A0A1S3KH27_LINAN|nr:steroid 17-alpha-hydroxylase/17,20 lyase-like [Lingula anatina]XP_013421526.1 steroid 17-alpha-hydroxylase/17,20 lyase-like [Lingula anatina]|eukprot:XP_013421525.1 steroid 17-alpha-hydroxylase/17,20 lyase-like [Lingula anatina]
MMHILSILSLLTVKTVLVGIAVFLLVMSYLQRKKYKLPPGPPQLPILGNYFAFRRDGRMYAVFTKLGKSFGDIFTVNFGFGNTVVVLNSAEMVHEAFVEKKEIFAGRDEISWKFELFSGGFRDIAFANYGPVWKLQRQMTLKAFRTYLAGDKLETLTRSAFDEVASLIEKETEPFDIDVHIRLLVFNIVCRMAFGKSYKIDEPEFVWLKTNLENTMQTFFGGVVPTDVIPVLKYFPIPSSLKIKRLTNDVIGFQKAKLEDHKINLKTGEARDIMEQMLLLREELTDESDDNIKESLTDTCILHTLLDIFVAGTNTTSDTLKWMIMYVADNPKIQAKIHKELDGLGKDFDNLRHCKSKLTYFEAVQREVMRVRPAAPAGLRHQTLCDTKLGGYDIPKGTLVYANFWTIHNDPNIWESPEVFKPERFLNKDGSLKELDNKVWVPFSSGKRKCVGEALARANIMMISALFFRRFKVSFPSGQKPDFEPSKLFEISCSPNPQKIIVHKRN